jgi:Transcriptional regulator of aromatic amino acids metabolism
MNFIESCIALIGTPTLLLTTIVFSFVFKLFILVKMLYRASLGSAPKKLVFLLSAVLIGASTTEVSWIIKLLRDLYLPGIDPRVIIFSMRIGWSATIAQYQALIFFVIYLTKEKLALKKRYLFLGISGAISFIYFIIQAIFDFNILSTRNRSPFEEIIIKMVILYVSALLVLSFIICIEKIRAKKLPRILEHQLKTFAFYIILPQLALEVVANNPFYLLFEKPIQETYFAAVTISTILIAYALYFCAKKMIAMRFLNIHPTVQAQAQFNFIDDFKNVLEQLSQVSSISELKHITSIFFKTAFNIPITKTKLYIRALDDILAEDAHPIIELYMEAPFIKQQKIFVRNEIEFSNFYDKQAERHAATDFLQRINAGAFIPLYDKKIIIGYITIEHQARDEQLFNNNEYDEMLIFSSYLGTIINLLRRRNLTTLIQQEKTLREELHHKHQEVNHYRESLRTFLHKTPNSEHAILLQQQLLKDPSNWDYLLYLETTNAGKLVSQHLPAAGEQLTDFKIALLKASLSRKAILLYVPEEDILPTVELMHHISLRDHLEVLDLTMSERNYNAAIKLFGINKLFESSESPALLEVLNNVGTLVINNVHLLTLETQRQLAHYIASGTFTPVKSDRTLSSNVHIICTSTQDLGVLVQSGNFSQELYHELNKLTVIMPALATLAPAELTGLVNGFAQQIIKNKLMSALFTLTEKEQQKFINDRPISLQELKDGVYQTLTNKAKRKKMDPESTFDTTYAIINPKLSDAIKLGKNALKDPHIMMFLWNQFKSQTKIAKLLDVNRSSVNRRFQEFGIISNDHTK